MVEISNNLLAGLLVVAIVISASSAFIISNIGPITVTGRTLEFGTANVTISGLAAIEMKRNVTNFGTSTIAGQGRTIHTQQENNWTGGGTFNNGSEGNGTNYGTGTPAYPFVVDNIGNVNVSINISTANEAGSGTPWIGTGAAAHFKGKNNQSTGPCAADFGSGFGEGSWTALNVSETVVCSDLNFLDAPETDELRIHFRIQIPSDAVGTKGEIVTIGALDSS